MSLTLFHVPIIIQTNLQTIFTTTHEYKFEKKFEEGTGLSKYSSLL
jgi:hypothetical protein